MDAADSHDGIGRFSIATSARDSVDGLVATKPASKQIAAQEYGKPARAVLLDCTTNEVVFAVVGYVGSGTSEIASALKGLLEQEKLEGGKFDVEILKARDVISDWGTRNDHPPPATPPNDLRTTSAFQDLGDAMRDPVAITRSSPGNWSRKFD